MPTDLLLKLLLYCGGPLLAAALIYFKGYFSGKSTELAKQKEAEEALQKELRRTTARNSKLDWERDQKIQEISGPKSTADLLQEWNKRWGAGKGGSEDTTH